MNFPFFKYHGTGNDFIIIDNRKGLFSGIEESQVAEMCHRRFGVGADGLILLSPSPTDAFFMDYFNSDGKRSSMCGNGGRCIVKFAEKLGMFSSKVSFSAIDGIHEAILTDAGVKLKMNMPSGFQLIDAQSSFIDTGSPHYVTFLQDGLGTFDVKKEGAKIRYSLPWNEKGTNVNFVEVLSDNALSVRTYERGVEDETWSCGTGVTAVAEIWSRLHPEAKQPITLHTPGGKLWVHTEKEKEPWLEGPAVFVFEGEWCR